MAIVSSCRWGLILTLDDVLFEVDSAMLKPGALRNMQPLLAFLRDNPDYRVVIEGHTDSSGAAAYNQRLSQQRASSVARHLGAMGLDSGRVETLGLGEEYPVASNASGAGRLQNRRVEVILLPSDRPDAPPLNASPVRG